MIPDWLRDKLASPPEAGAGIHAWLFSVARQLHAHMPAGAVEAVLSAATANAGRHVTGREIRDAVANSQAVAWEPTPKGQDRVSNRRSMGNPMDPQQSNSDNEAGVYARSWPKQNPAEREWQILTSASSGVSSLNNLRERSPVRLDDGFKWTVDDWLDWLFPGAEWLCLAVDHPATARSRRREGWSFGPAEECGLLVPSPMTGPGGTGLDGRRSHRCLDNTGPRRWLVVEFDKLEDGKTDMPADDQAALHWCLRSVCETMGWPPLRLVVHSGKRSLHGWYGPISDESAALELMTYAVSLGADPATWLPCQLVRLPGGRRTIATTTAHQAVLFFNP